MFKQGGTRARAVSAGVRHRLYSGDKDTLVQPRARTRKKTGSTVFPTTQTRSQEWLSEEGTRGRQRPLCSAAGGEVLQCRQVWRRRVPSCSCSSSAAPYGWPLQVLPGSRKKP